MIRPSVRFAGAAAVLVALSLLLVQALRADPGSRRAARRRLRRPRLPPRPSSPSPIPRTSPLTLAHQGNRQRLPRRPAGATTQNRIWQVQAILKTPVEGISKVVVLVGDKTGKEKPSVA